MLDVKKIITSFLILALGASAGAWILSGTNNRPAAEVSAGSPSSTALSASGSAFLPSANSNVYLPSLPDEATSSGGLTDALSGAVIDSIVAANPNGPQQDENGDTMLNQPDEPTLTSELQNSPSLRNVAVPNWDAEAANFQKEIKIVPFSSSTATDYANGVSQAINQELVATGLQGIVQQNAPTLPDPTPFISTSNSSAATLLSLVTKIPTPASFADFQKSFIKLLVYEKEYSHLAESVDLEDPATTAVTMQSEDAGYQQALKDFQIQEQDLRASLAENRISPEHDGVFLAFLEKIFVHRAYATGIPVVDWLEKLMTSLGFSADTATQWSTYLAKVAQDAAIQIAKNIIQVTIQKKVLAYIQNSGAPRFIQNFGTDLVNAGEMSAMNALNSNAACINTQTAMPSIQLVLNAIYKPGNNACESQFASQLSGANLTNFFNNFANGSFLTFGQTLTPSNDFYGGLFFSAQNAEQASQQGQGLFSLKTNTSQGYKPSQQCGDQSDPNGVTYTCQNGAKPDADHKCSNGPDLIPDEAIGAPNLGKCANGADPSVTMPGIVNAQALGKQLGGSQAEVAAANSIAGLVEFAAQDLLMGLVNMGVNAVTGAYDNAIQGNAGFSGNGAIQPTAIGGSQPTSTSASALSCSPTATTLETPGVQTEFFALGGTYDANANAPTYTWTSSDGETGSGMIFSPTYMAVGTFTVTLKDSSGDAPATCSAVVGTANGLGGVYCFPLNQTSTFASVTLAADGGATSTNGGASYVWSAPGSTDVNGGAEPGDPLQVTYGGPGTYTVSVTDLTDNSDATCNVVIQ